MNITYQAFTISRNNNGDPVAVAFLFPEAILPEGSKPRVDAIRHTGNLNADGFGLTLNLDLDGQEIEIPVNVDAQKDGAVETINAVRTVIENQGEILFIESVMSRHTFQIEARKTTLPAQFFESDHAFMEALAEEWRKIAQAM